MLIKEEISGGKEMTKKCKICELFGENHVGNHGLSHPCHLANLQQSNILNLGLNYDSDTSYVNHGLLNGLYLPQLKDMMLAAYLLRGTLLFVCPFFTEEPIFTFWKILAMLNYHLAIQLLCINVNFYFYLFIIFIIYCL